MGPPQGGDRLLGPAQHDQERAEYAVTLGVVRLYLESAPKLGFRFRPFPMTPQHAAQRRMGLRQIPVQLQRFPSRLFGLLLIPLAKAPCRVEAPGVRQTRVGRAVAGVALDRLLEVIDGLRNVLPALLRQKMAP